MPSGGTCNVTEGTASASASSSATGTLDAADRNARVSEFYRWVLPDGTVVSEGTEGATKQTYWYDSYTGTYHYDSKPVFASPVTVASSSLLRLRGRPLDLTTGGSSIVESEGEGRVSL